jgi:tetratricopeptide (TPR) repeat protein
VLRQASLDSCLRRLSEGQGEAPPGPPIKKNRHLRLDKALGLGLALITAWQPQLWGRPGLDAGTSNPYGNYLVIKYLLHLNEFEKAETLINRYLETSPQDPFVLTEKAYLLSQVKGKFEEALQCLKQSIAIYPDYYYANYLQAFILFTLSDLAIKTDTDAKKKADQAIRCLETSIKDNPDFYDAYYLMGVILNARADSKGSNDYFEKANRLEENATSYLYMASNYQQLNEPSKVIAAYQKILTFNPSNYRALSALSEIYLGKKDYKNATPYLEKLFRQNPQNQKAAIEYLYSLIAAGETEKFMKATADIDISTSAPLQYAKALLLTQEKKYSEAEQLLKSVEPKDSKTYFLMAEIHLHQHNYYLAYQTLENIETRDRTPLYYSMRLYTLSLLNMNRQILRLYDFLQDKPAVLEKLTTDDYYTCLFAAANLNLLEKMREIARTAAHQQEEQDGIFKELLPALRDFPGNNGNKETGIKALQSELNLLLFETLYKNRQQYQQAISIIDALIRKNEDNLNAHLELCNIYLEQKQFDQAEPLLKKLIRRFPSSLAVKNTYAYFLALQNKKLDHALELSAYTLSRDQENPAYIDTYGTILFRLGRFPEAGTYLEKAHRKNPFEQEIMDHLVEYYRSQPGNRNQQIIEIYKNAIQHQVDFKDRLIERIEKLEKGK